MAGRHHEGILRGKIGFLAGNWCLLFDVWCLIGFRSRLYNLPFMSETLKNFIGGQWVLPKKARLLEDRNPATGQLLARFPASAPIDAQTAIAAAKSAFPAWRATPAPKRGEILRKASQILEKRKEDLAQSLTREMGKVLVEARGDVQEAVDIGYYMAAEGRRQFGQTVPSELAHKFMMTVREPLGVVSLITPWNFPIAIPSWKMTAALILGNTVVLKPAEDTPICAARYVEVLEEAGIPPGVVNLILGQGATLGKTLVTHPDVSAISFTGSTATGKLINSQAAPLLKRVTLEMGGKNAILVMEDADLDLALDGIVWSAFGTSGQRCTAASRLIVHKKILAEVERRLVARAQKLRLGNGLDAKTDVGPVVNGQQLVRIHRYVQIGLKKDKARLLCGGSIARSGKLAQGFFYQPTVFTNVAPSMAIAQEEIFGPVVAILPVGSLEEAVEVANGTRYGLSSSIYTRDVNRAFYALRRLEAGLVYVNAGTIGAEVSTPFGGVKETGNGHREAGQAALDFFGEWKSIFIDYSGRLQRAQID